MGKLDLGPESSLTEIIQVGDIGGLDIYGSRGGGRNGWILDIYLRKSHRFSQQIIWGGGVQNDAIVFHLSSYKAEFPFPDAGETKWPECAEVNSGVACGRLRDRSLS